MSGNIILACSFLFMICICSKPTFCYSKLGAHGYDNIEDDMKVKTNPHFNIINATLESNR